MKKFLLLALLLAFTSVGLGQGSGPITVKEIDGSPVCNSCRTFIFPNGSLTVSGNKVTVASGGGSGSPGGSNTQLQYNNGGSFGGITGATTNGTVVTLTSPVFVTPALGTPVSGVATNLTGTAAGLTAGAATVLATPRTINGTIFDGSANITVTAAAGTLTGATLAAGVTASSLTSFGSTPTIITPSFTTGFTIGGVAATGTIPRGNGTNFVASAYTMAAPGTTGNVLTSDGTNWTSAAPAGGSGITVGTTTITSGTSGRLPYNNAGVYGEISTLTSDGSLLAFASGVTTGTGATSGLNATANSLTTGTAFNFTSSSVTSGSIVNIASTSTAGATGVEGLNIAMSGANGTSAQTITGATIAVTNTNATSGTNVGLTLTASGATTANTALNVTAGMSVFPAGTSTVPSVAIGDSTTGFWNNSGVQLNFITQSTTRATINSEGIRLGSGLGFVWSDNSVPSGGTVDLSIVRKASSVMRITNGSTGAGSLVLGTSTVGSIGTSGVGVLAIANGTAPSSRPADEYQNYSADYAAGDARMHVLSETNAQPVIIGNHAVMTGVQHLSKTGDYTVVIADSNAFFDNVGAGAGVIFTLPTPQASPSLYNCFCRVDNQVVTVDVTAGITIQAGASVTTSGGNVTLDAVGSCIWLYSVSSTKWFGIISGAATFN